MTFSRPPIPVGIATLLDMLAVRRPCGSKSERRWIAEHLRPLGVTADAFGNLYKRIGDAPILWSSHTDTVHRKGGVQSVSMDGAGVARLAKGEKLSNCLGADDTAGVWLMREMIRANKPGLYVFHRMEECGGLGSGYIAQDTPELLAGIQFAVALDRRGTTDVITHQAHGRCASDEFAASLASCLGGLDYKPSPNGIFTDTANYTDIIGECTNLSVGYRGEHSPDETLDTRHLNNLLDALLSLDVGALVSKRKPGELDAEKLEYWAHLDAEWENREPTPSARQRARTAWAWDDEHSARTMDLQTLVREYPAEIAEWLYDQGYNPADIEDAVLAYGGALRSFRR